MRKSVRVVGLVGVCGLGVATAVAVGAASGKGVPACATRATGEIHVRSGGRCATGEFAITISGEAFRSSRGGTLTINGVAFSRRRQGPRDTLTINGTAFKGSSKGGTLTINGTSFKSSKGGTLTINGIPFTEAAGKPGAQGPQGVAGAPGAPGTSTLPVGPPPTEAPGPVNVKAAGSTTKLASATVSYSDAKAHRVLVSGGFDAVCGPCEAGLPALFGVSLGGTTQFLRHVPALMGAGTEGSSVSFSEIVVTPDVCGPCTLDLSARIDAGAGGSSPAFDASGIRFGVVDLGPVG